ncbi:MAG: hypothetical protein NZ551_10925 [Microscillaceae bacterium]|nr:hypothetical protein [Microscillaceae bacterium]MDW8461709.1 hypothetical protein [Cytophagales bacterium]
MKKIINTSIIVIALFVIWACKKERLVYNGPLQLEFKNIYLEMQASLGAPTVRSFGIITEFNTTLTSLTVSRGGVANISPFTGTSQPVLFDSIRVQLIGPHQEQPITVNYTVETESTAQAGIHYNFVESIRHINRRAKTTLGAVLVGSVIAGGSTVIPANSSHGYIYLQIPNTGPALPANGVNLILRITGGTLGDGRNIKAAANYSVFTYNIRP